MVIYVLTGWVLAAGYNMPAIPEIYGTERACLSRIDGIREKAAVTEVHLTCEPVVAPAES